MKDFWFIILSVFVFGQLQSQNENATAEGFLKKGDSLLVLGSYTESYANLTKALTLFEQRKDDLGVLKTRNTLARHHILNSNRDEAFTQAELCLDIIKKSSFSQSLEKSETLNLLGEIHGMQGQIEKSLRYHHLADEIVNEHFSQDKFAKASNYLRLGIATHGLRKLDEALQFFDKAIVLNPDKSLKGNLLLADIHEASGYVYYEQGDLMNALISFNKAISILEEKFSGSHPHFIKLHNALGLVHTSKEHFYKSLKHYEKALDVSIQNFGIDGDIHQVFLNYNIGTIYSNLKNRKKAIFHTKKTIKLGSILFGENHYQMYYPYSQLGKILGGQEGILYLNKALNICLTNPTTDNSMVASIHEYLSEIHLSLNQEDDALENSRKSLELRTKELGNNNPVTVQSINNLAEIYLELEDLEQAAFYVERAISQNLLSKGKTSKKNGASIFFNKSVYLQTVVLKAKLFYKKYLLHNNLPNLLESAQHLKEATGIIEDLRLDTRNFEDKKSFSSTVRHVYNLAIEVNLLLQKITQKDEYGLKAFTFSQRSKSNVLIEFLREFEISEDLGNSPERKLLQGFNDDIAEVKTQLLKSQLEIGRDTTKLYSLRGKLFDLENRKDSLKQKFESNYLNPFMHRSFRGVLSLHEIQNRLKSKTAVIEFFKADSISYAFLLTKKNFEMVEIPERHLDAMVKTFVKSLANKNKNEQIRLGKALYQTLIEPLANLSGKENLVIIPDGALWHLPFDLLISDENNKKPHYLLYDHAISYVNAIDFLFKDLQIESSNSSLKGCLAFSYSSSDSINTLMPSQITLRDFKNYNADLPGTRKEIKSISKIFEGKYFYGREANKANFRKNIAKYDIIHLALHADIQDNNFQNAKMYFSPTTKPLHDNELYSHELLGLKIPASLVVLSGCATGTGDISKGEGVQSLGTAFQYAGASSLVLSRWNISDKTTPDLMTSFYQNLKSGMDKAKALQQAKISFIQESNGLFDDPFYWGSFFLLGDIAPINTNNDVSFLSGPFVIVGSLTLLFFGIGFMFLRRSKLKT